MSRGPSICPPPPQSLPGVPMVPSKVPDVEYTPTYWLAESATYTTLLARSTDSPRVLLLRCALVLNERSNDPDEPNPWTQWVLATSIPRTRPNCPPLQLLPLVPNSPMKLSFLSNISTTLAPEVSRPVDWTT